MLCYALQMSETPYCNKWNAGLIEKENLQLVNPHNGAEFLGQYVGRSAGVFTAILWPSIMETIANNWREGVGGWGGGGGGGGGEKGGIYQYLHRQILNWFNCTQNIIYSWNRRLVRSCS